MNASRTLPARTSSRPRYALPGAILLLLAGLALALPAQARPGGFGRGGPGGPARLIERHAEELGIDEATLAEIDAIVEASRAEADAIYEEHRAAREAMHALLEQDEPDVDAVMRHADTMGVIDVRKHKHRLKTLLAIRAKLTPEQRSRLSALMDDMHERHEKRREHRGKGGKGWHRGGDCPCAGASPDDESEEM